MKTLLLTAALAALPQEPDPAPLKVFLLAGQSNMEGQAVVDLDHEEHYNGGRGILTRVLEDPELAPTFGHLRNPDGDWRVRDDVWVWYRAGSGERKIGPLSIGFAVYGGLHHFGPELMFGDVVGDEFDEPVLLVKACWGGKSLHVDFRPPGAGGETGPYYGRILEELSTAMANLETDLPALKGFRPELSGLVWFQGWNDMVNAEATAAYEDNLVHLIGDLRKALDSPDLPVVVAETGNCNSEALRSAQAAATRREEVGKRVRFVPTGDFLRAPEDSPNTTHGHHWYGNAESYLRIGEAMGRAMVELLEDDSSR